MEKLTKIEKDAVAFLIRQEINDGKKTLEEIEKVLKTKVDDEEFAKDMQIYIDAFEGYKVRKKRFEEIARKLEIEL